MNRVGFGCSRVRGFSLIEMMIVLAIIGILAAIAYPNYMDSVIKGRRADAGDALLYIQQLQEKYRANHIDFGTLSEIGYGADATEYSTDGYYVMTTTGDGSSTAYTIKAVAKTGTSQASDTGNPVDCKTLTLTVNVTNPRGFKGSTNVGDGTKCWAN